jgi:hypothetical protein
MSRWIRPFFVASLLVAGPVMAADTKDVEPLMTVRGKQLVTENFAAEALPAGWTVAKGVWAVKDGVLHGKEVASDMHAAVVRTNAAVENGIYQFDFRFDGAKQTHISINGAKGHICRVTILAGGFQVRKDGTKNSETDKGVLLDSCKMTFEQGQWYTMLVEISGKEILARVDDKHFAFGADDKVALPKANFAFPVSGETLAIDNVRAWTATSNPKWAETKAKLTAEHPEKMPAAAPARAKKAQAK